MELLHDRVKANSRTTNVRITQVWYECASLGITWTANIYYEYKHCVARVLMSVEYEV